MSSATPSGGHSRIGEEGNSSPQQDGKNDDADQKKIGLPILRSALLLLASLIPPFPPDAFARHAVFDIERANLTLAVTLSPETRRRINHIRRERRLRGIDQPPPAVKFPHLLFRGVRGALRRRFSHVIRGRNPAEARGRGADLLAVLDARWEPANRRSQTARTTLRVTFRRLNGSVIDTLRAEGRSGALGASGRRAVTAFREALSNSRRLAAAVSDLEGLRAGRSPPSLPPEAVARRDEAAPRKAPRRERTPAGSPGPRAWRSAGTGFLLRGTAYILTSHHVVQGVGRIRVSFPSGATYPGAVTAKDANNDLALVLVQSMRPKREGFVPELAAQVRPGEAVHALGYPLGSRLSRNPSIVSGQVSAVTGLEDNIAQFRMTTPINEGNSGGPVINAHGTLIGIAAAGLVQQGVEAVRFATKISAAGVLLGQAQLARKFSISVRPKQEGPLPPHEIFRRYSPHVVLIERKQTRSGFAFGYGRWMAKSERLCVIECTSRSNVMPIFRATRSEAVLSGWRSETSRWKPQA
ncbi:MAG: serine protease [Nitrospinota bacterium]|nr:serine protease [Nitrospinota bacterium]